MVLAWGCHEQKPQTPFHRQPRTLTTISLQPQTSLIFGVISHGTRYDMPQPLAVDMRSTSHEFGSAHAIDNSIRLPSNPINNRPEKTDPGTNPNSVQGAMVDPSYGTPLSCHTCYASDLGSYIPSLDCNPVIPEEIGNQYLFTQYKIFGDFNSGQVGPRSYLPGQTGRCNAGGYQPCSDQLFNSTPSTDYGYSDFYSPDERIQ